MTTVGYKAPRLVAGRAIALVAMLGSLIVVGALVSQITGILQEQQKASVVSTLDDVDGRPVGVVGGSNSAEYLEDQDIDTVEFASQRNVFEAAGNGDLDLLVSNQYVLTELGPDFGIETSGDVLYEEFETFRMPADSPWREPLNRVLADPNCRETPRLSSSVGPNKPTSRYWPISSDRIGQRNLDNTCAQPNIHRPYPKASP